MEYRLFESYRGIIKIYGVLKDIKVNDVIWEELGKL